MLTKEQKRAKNALDRVTDLKAKGKSFRDAYRPYVDGLGPAIVMNGLGQALATELAAGSGSGASPEAHKELYSSLQQWLCDKNEGVYPGKPNLLNAIMSHDEERYLLAQAEALAWLEWHKKFCRAEFGSSENSNETS